MTGCVGFSYVFFPDMGCLGTPNHQASRSAGRKSFWDTGANDVGQLIQIKRLQNLNEDTLSKNSLSFRAFDISFAIHGITVSVRGLATIVRNSQSLWSFQQF
jgi:hypothetical protein